MIGYEQEYHGEKPFYPFSKEPEVLKLIFHFDAFMERFAISGEITEFELELEDFQKERRKEGDGELAKKQGKNILSEESGVEKEGREEQKKEKREQEPNNFSERLIPVEKERERENRI
ncbi:uncharacterized protein MONOS_8844 [Monocercomonoides exilis]|uniref:uncharacterized protein n=1 Tax=Monocercomonoides exilis TaxID=2049356 RepID=UPI003559536C|nr:hypothetical protein MONOS_8844 [Monocercomonoides exilis]|eukprot:MONOS_8844.1-p1 / transcript=MONOS_8844.1 / gene=MONOS_8844 / organism=Monocercomonoides_exilis_PA203 / gene_product=unspecified product / transcript_product=unspecified product / location=Mono_scaffold00345:19496-20164(-) / protein_length=118 / sequence_SO=supercontig / SO=protein_coding / is_pseudo=false